MIILLVMASMSEQQLIEQNHGILMKKLKSILDAIAC